MSFKIKQLCLIVVFIILITGLWANISRIDAENLVINNILQTQIDSVDVYIVPTIQDTCSINLYDGRNISPSYDSNWVFFIDDCVSALYSHPCRFIFVDEVTGSY